MNDIELAQLFVDYAKLRDQLELTKDMIIKAVLDKRETVKLAGVTATYYKASTGTPLYEEAIAKHIGEHPEYKEELKQFQTYTVITTWKDACGFFGLTPEPGEEKPARVVIK